MEIVEKWGITNFSTWFPEVWNKVKSYLLELAPYDKCFVEEIDKDWIRLVFINKGESAHFLEYETSDLHDLTIDDLISDMKKMKRLLNADERKLLQMVFDAFRKNNEWPNSRTMIVKVADANLGNYFKMAKNIGVKYIRVGDEYHKDSISELTIRGVALCRGSSEYIQLFINVMRAFIERFKESPENSKIKSQELIDRNVIREDQKKLVHHMIGMEPG